MFCSFFVASAAVTKGEESAVTSLLVPFAFAPTELQSPLTKSSDSELFNSFPALAQIAGVEANIGIAASRIGCCGNTNGFNQNSNFAGSAAVTSGDSTGTFIYEWQHGTADGNYEIAFGLGVTSANYQIQSGRISGGTSSGGWDVSKTHLRLKATYSLSGSTKVFYSTPLQISQLATGTLIDFADMEYSAAGGILTANISSITDLNNGLADFGKSVISYTWERKANNSASFVSITSGTTETTYTIKASDFADLVSEQKPIYKVIVNYRDSMGFSNPIIATAEVNVQVPSIDDVEIGVILASVNIINGGNVTATGNVTSGNSGGTFSYEWQWGNTDSTSFVDVTANANGSVFQYVSGASSVTDKWDNDFTHLRVKAIYNLFGNTKEVTSAPIAISFPATGGVAIGFTDIAYSTTGEILTVNADVSSVTDLNDGGSGNDVTDTKIFTNYTWLRKASNSENFLTLTSGTDTTYAIKESDFDNLVTGEKPVYQVIANYLDKFGFSNPITATAAVNLQMPTPTEGNIVITESPIRNFSGAFSFTNGNLGSVTSYKWQRSPNSTANFTNISGAISQTYNLNPTNWDTTNRYLRLQIIYTNAFGIESTHNSAVTLVYSPLSALLEIGEENNRFTASISNLIGDTSNTTYIWSRRLREAESFSPIHANRRNREIYTLHASDFVGLQNSDTAPALQLAIIISDVFGGRLSLTSTLIISRSEIGNNIQITPPLTIVNNASFSANFSNSGGNTSYQWQAADVNDTFANLSNGDFQTYVLRSSLSNGDWNTNNTQLRVQGIHTDDFGVAFTATSTANTINSAGVLEVNILATDAANRGSRLTAFVTFEDANIDSENPGRFRYIWSTRTNGGGDVFQSSDNSVYVLRDSRQGLNLFLRVIASDSLGYTTISDSQFTFNTNPALGGNLEIFANNFSNGGRFTANLTFTENGSGRVTYQWQQGKNTYSNIATGRIFILSSTLNNGGNWNTNNTHLRVIATHTDSLQRQLMLTASVQISQSPTRLEVSLFASNNAFAGSTITANISSFSDANNGGGNIGQIRYIWSTEENGGSVLQSGNENVFVLASPQQAASLYVQIIFTDGLGYIVTENEKLTFNQSEISGTAEILPTNNFANNAQFTATINISESINTVTYQWQQGRGNTYFNLTIGEVFILSSSLNSDGGNWNTNNTHLRMIATHIDSLGRELIVTASLPIAKSPEVQSKIILPSNIVAGIKISVGDRITANVTVTDANNGGGQNGQTVFIWKDAAATNGNVLLSGVAESVFVVQNVSPTLAFSIFLELRHTDGLGYVTSHERNLILGNTEAEVLKTNIGNAVNIFNLVAAQSAAGALGTHLDSVSSAASTGGFLSINDIPLNSAQDLASALSNKKADSLHPNKNFGVDSFALRQSGKKGEQEWSTWLSGNAANIRGEPDFNGTKFSYKGTSQGVFGGVDRQFGNLRSGFAVGNNSAEIDTDFTPESGGGKDKISRELQVFMPYLEWRNPESGSQFRAMVGTGFGKLQIRESNNGCSANLDEVLYFGKIGGDIVYEGSTWEQSLNGSYSFSNSHVDKGDCSATTILPQTNANVGEWQLGGQIAYAPDDVTISPRFGINARKSFGDTEDLAYDLYGRILFGRADDLGMSAGVEGSLQFNDPVHRRNLISGWIIYRGGKVHTSVRSEIDAAAALKHRWSLHYENKQNQNQLGGELYIENTANNKANIGGALQVRF